MWAFDPIRGLWIIWRDNMLLDKIYYTVDSLEGDYAYLKKDGHVSDETKCDSRA